MLQGMFGGENRIDFLAFMKPCKTEVCAFKHSLSLLFSIRILFNQATQVLNFRIIFRFKEDRWHGREVHGSQ